MRNTLITGTAVALLAASALGFANTPPMRKPGGAGLPRAPWSAAPRNSTAYERAVTVYLDNVVEKARKKLPHTPPAPLSHHQSDSRGPGYPGASSAGEGLSRPSLPRVERITIGVKARAVLETPHGGRLRVSPGVVTPYGQVTAIRAAGVWFRRRGAHHAVELADIAGSGRGAASGMPAEGENAMQGPPRRVPIPPNLQSAPPQ